MKHKNVLFLCSANRLRSPTAEHVFADWPNVETDSAGLDDSASVVLSSEQLRWADLIFVMENRHRSRLSKKYKKHLNGQKVITLGIPDDYEYMHPDLIQLLEAKAGPFLR
jgi:predicted protein tyrosine phosphatase